MLLSDIFNQLTHGELSQLDLGGAAFGIIQPDNYDKIVPHVNLALTALYKRFNLKVGKHTLALLANQQTYTLPSDLLKVEQVVTSAQVPFPLNDALDLYSVNTPTYRSLEVPLDVVNQVASLPEEYKTLTLGVTYRASHPKVELFQFNPNTINIELPETHLMALLYFIASRVNNPIGMTNEFHAGNSYAAKYEAECKSLENDNLEIDQGTGNSRLQENGWV